MPTGPPTARIAVRLLDAPGASLLGASAPGAALGGGMGGGYAGRAMIEVACEACGWLAVTSQPVHLVWAEHEEACPAVGGAVRHMPELPPLPKLLPPVNACAHRPVRRQIAVTPRGVKRYAVTCALCGRYLEGV